jgi:hypothetical protein
MIIKTTEEIQLSYIDRDKKWISVESLLPKLEETFNKSQPISTKVALGRIIKEIKEE